MSDTISRALKRLIEGGGLNLLAFSDQDFDADQARPYCTIHEGITTTPLLRTANGQGESVTELVQVDLWEDWVSDDDYLYDEPSTADDLVTLLHHARLPSAAKRVDEVLVVSKRRMFESARTLVHHPITLRIVRAA